MKYTRAVCGIGVVMLMLVFAVYASSKKPAAVQPPAFSFPVGAEWTYKGVVKWAQNGRPRQKTLEWKMQVLNKIMRNDGIYAYVIKGHPGDLVFYSSDTRPGSYLYLVNKNLVYEIETGGPEDIVRVRNKNDDLKDLMNEDNLIFYFPLVLGKKFGDEKWVKSDKGMYCWVVEGEDRIKLKGIKGIGTSDAVESRLSLRTNPDTMFVFYVPGLGITRFEYYHHGSLSEVNMKLVEYNQGKH